MTSNKSKISVDDIDQSKIDALRIKILKWAKKESTDETDKVLNKVIRRYLILQQSFDSFMNYCNVYAQVQNELVSKLSTANNNDDIEKINNQILRNAIVLVQMYKYIENGERYSPNDFAYNIPFNKNKDGVHSLGYIGCGCDDFLNKERRRQTNLMELESTVFKGSGKSIDDIIEKHFYDLNNIPTQGTEKLNQLKTIIPTLTIAQDLSSITLNNYRGGVIKSMSTSILTPLFNVTFNRSTVPVLSEEQWSEFGSTSTGNVREIQLKTIYEWKKNDCPIAYPSELEVCKAIIRLETPQVVQPTNNKKAPNNTKRGKITLKKKGNSNNSNDSDEDDEKLFSQDTSKPQQNVTNSKLIDDDDDEDEETKKSTAKTTSMQLTSTELTNDDKKFPATTSITGNASDDSDSPINADSIFECTQPTPILENYYVDVLMNKKCTKDERECIKIWMKITESNRSDIMAEKNSDRLDRESLSLLREDTWLNDAVINFYLIQCLQKSSETCLILSSFFYQKLMDEYNTTDQSLQGKYNYEKVKTWKCLRNINIFEKDKISIPINEEAYHWVLVVVDVRNKVIQHYDSCHKQRRKERDSDKNWTKSPVEYYTLEESFDIQSSFNESMLKRLENVLRYLNDKHLTTFEKKLSLDWKMECVMAPTQSNGKIVMIKLKMKYYFSFLTINI
jgi:hypothetical protein